MAFQACIVEGSVGSDNTAGLKELLENLKESSLVLLYPVEQKSLEVYSTLAEEYSLYLSPGTICEKEGGDLFKTGLLFGPDGNIVLKQKQLFVNRSDREKGINSGSDVNVVSTELGNIGFMVEEDCWHPEVGRFMALEGVDLVLATNKISNGDYWKQLAGVWSQVQQNQFFALEASRGGRDIIHGPCEITPYRTGILAPVGEKRLALGNNPPHYLELMEAEQGIEGKQMVAGYNITLARVDLNKLREIRRSYPLLKHLNPGLYRKVGLEGLSILQKGDTR